MVVSMDERHIPPVGEQAPEFALADSTGVEYIVVSVVPAKLMSNSQKLVLIPPL